MNVIPLSERMYVVRAQQNMRVEHVVLEDKGGLWRVMYTCDGVNNCSREACFDIAPDKDAEVDALMGGALDAARARDLLRLAFWDLRESSVPTEYLLVGLDRYARGSISEVVASFWR